MSSRMAFQVGDRFVKVNPVKSTIGNTWQPLPELPKEENDETIDG